MYFNASPMREKNCIRDALRAIAGSKEDRFFTFQTILSQKPFLQTELFKSRFSLELFVSSLRYDDKNRNHI